ncbi:hypothetical protein PMAYCL1PPCAC_03660 [Pristionchus mayeri]|uniref:Ribosomal protein n=1 Tax=Pristionchus mayeri TaxID=1317129 RepID=A0AAN4Z3U8_9BILA|nr:hypothetical protein PMAYCL1PPCAC_03660 [Pristionchus mayeri]
MPHGLRAWVLIERTESHVVVGLLLLRCGGCGGSSCCDGSSGSGEGSGVGEVGLDLLGRLEGDVGDGCDSEHVLESGGEGVGHGSSRGVLDGKRHGGNVADSLEEAGTELRGGEVEDLRGVDRSVVVDLEDNQTVRERGDSQHVEQGSLGSSDLVAGGDEVVLIEDLNGSSGDLGGDLESLEERGLLRSQSGVLGSFTSQGAMAPALAGAPWESSRSLSRISDRSSLVKTNPTFWTM